MLVASSAALAVASLLHFGAVTVDRHVCDVSECQTSVDFVSGETRKTISFFVGDEVPGTVEVARIRIPAVDRPLFVAIGVSPGGSDIHFQTLFLSADAPFGQVSPLFETSSLDAICIGSFGGKPGALLAEFLWEDESHYAAHRYRVTVFTWDGAEFKRLRVRETRAKYRSWQSAVRELGFACNANLIDAVALPAG